MAAEPLPSLLEVDLDSSRRGLRSRLSEDLGGEPVLRRTVEGVLACQRVAAPLLVVPRIQEEAARQLVRDLPVQWFSHEFPDIAVRARLRRGRLWGKEGWRGGIGDAFFAGEAGNPAAFVAAYERQGWHAAIHIPAEAALVDPQALDEIASVFLDERQGAPVYLSTAPPGIAGDIVALPLLKQFRELGCSFEKVFPFLPDRPEHDAEIRRAFHHFSEKITGFRGRFTVDSSSTLELVRVLWERLQGNAERISSVRLFEFLRDHPDVWAGPTPEELLVEVGGDQGGVRPARHAALGSLTQASRTEGSPGSLNGGSFTGGTIFKGGTIPEAVWGRVCESFAQREDGLLTLGGGYHDPLLDLSLEERIGRARRAGALGIHVQTSPANVDKPRAESLLDSGLEVISVALGSPGRESIPGLESLLEARDQLQDPPFVLVSVFLEETTTGNLEAFFDRWFARVDRILVRGADGPRGEVIPETLGVFAPPRRFSCARLTSQMRIEWDGRVPLCDRDPDPVASAGSLAESSVAEIWHGPRFREAREVHRRGEWDGYFHCGPCTSWFRFD